MESPNKDRLNLRVLIVTETDRDFAVHRNVIPSRFDPYRSLRPPRSVKVLVPTPPPVIADEASAKPCRSRPAATDAHH